MGKQSANLADKMRGEVAKASISLVLEIVANLRKNPKRGGTPVDTGHARANWVPSVGTPSTSIVAGANSAPHDSGIAAVLAYKIGTDAQPLFVSNNVPYIQALNYGHSKQAAMLFIEAAMDKALETVETRLAGQGITLRGEDQ